MAIVGIVVGCFVLVFIIAFTLVFVMKKKHHQEELYLKIHNDDDNLTEWYYENYLKDFHYVNKSDIDWIRSILPFLNKRYWLKSFNWTNLSSLAYICLINSLISSWYAIPYLLSALIFYPKSLFSSLYFLFSASNKLALFLASSNSFSRA